jgi:hypothetical protein
MDAERIAAVARELREFAKAGLRDNNSQSRRRRLLERSVILRGLTPVQLAGRDPTAQYEYLIQAIVDAIDAIALTGSPLTSALRAPAPSEAAREALAMRALFGLTGQTRGKTWRARQEAAASILNVSWDYFRHDLQEGLLCSVTELILVATRENHPSSVLDRAPGLWAFATQNDIETLTIDYIREQRPPRAALLELSTATTGSVLRALRDVGASIYLLAANPERVSGWQEARMRRSLTDLLHIDFDGYDQLRLHLYSVPPSLRGRNIGDLITLGWYTHRDNKRIDAFDAASVEVWGHDNAVVMGRSNDAEGAVLTNWFSREFQRLWNHRSTLDETTSVRILSVTE